MQVFVCIVGGGGVVFFTQLSNCEYGICCNAAPHKSKLVSTYYTFLSHSSLNIVLLNLHTISNQLYSCTPILFLKMDTIELKNHSLGITSFSSNLL